MKELSDFELNKAIALIIHPIEKLRFYESGRIRVVLGELIDAHDIEAFGGAQYLDYCNNWNDLMPLVVKFRINLIFPEEENRFIADKVEYTPHPEEWCHFVGNNPQKVLAECLLNLLEAM